MKKTGLGIIGLGYIGLIHLRNSLKLENSRVVAVSDVSKRALADAKKAGVKKCYTDYAELLKDEEVDSVIIALPTHLHSECAIAAAELGKNIFLEKPIARNPSEARSIISISEKNSVKLMVGYPLRFNTEMANLRREIKNGSLGDIETAFATFIDSGPFMHRNQDYTPIPVPEWWFRKELTGGGALIDLGSHMINLLRWYFGEVAEIRTRLKYRFNFDFEDSAICFIRFESGTSAVLNVGWFSQQYHQDVAVFGTVRHGVARSIIPKPIPAALQMISMGTTTFWRPHFAELEHFVNCVVSDEQPQPSALDGLKDLEVIQRGYENKFL
jgi:myo-inositol 2-dehydrogenase / D-chiro-inositol 1-dehydrogenase